MALPQLVKQLVEKKLSDYCKSKVSPELSEKIRMGFRIRRDNVTLFESRPSFPEPSHWVEIPVAQFRFDPGTGLWTLYCADRNSRWHYYVDVDPSKNLQNLLKEVDQDPTGIFWG
ncbi:protein of unknown function DUF3024 [Geotalea daltonii FRC-32]|uniref:Uncharacterized protein n=1 Tax=Geotalea daltonii (strain DSM 22248 / JCM 15807 / FRC-32) TaxID=316067 RepID=B9M388_GEODF|nr:DUF3024 domain-containing protein [Geotalea daltonii]ACM19498.1 protein of unknown function DUF3024 [Geotalea daltonii FRC-32]